MCGVCAPMEMNVELALFAFINASFRVIDIAVFVEPIVSENIALTEELSLGVSLQDTAFLIVFFRSQLEFWVQALIKEFKDVTSVILTAILDFSVELLLATDLRIGCRRIRVKCPSMFVGIFNLFEVSGVLLVKVSD